MDTLKIVAIGDIHYSTRPVDIKERKGEYGLEFLKRVIRRYSREAPDIIVILGDILNEAEGMDKLLPEIKKVIGKAGLPVVAIPGNHDADYVRFFSILGKPEPFIFKNFILYPFVDTYGENDTCSREKEDIEKFIYTIKRHPDKKVIVLQHNPVYPMIESSYPYNLTNAEKVHQCYKENRIVLSLSGHYHTGQGLTCKDGVNYLTVPALCEEPFGYFIIEIKGDSVKVRRENLKSQTPLFDNHCHTQFAYCAEDVTIEKILERVELFGMEYVCFTEHADQLYLTREEYGRCLSFYNPDIIRIAREEKRDRMRQFKEAVNKVRSEKVKMGLEVTPDKDGGISLLPEDREGLDILVGAIHFFPEEILAANTSKREIWFMDNLETLVKNKVDVLAHPFRVFLRSGLVVPATLFHPVVEILKGYNVAAELNFHTNIPEYKFFELCLAEGIKISPGTDTHNLIEAGEFYQHIKFLSELGVSQDMLDSILYKLP